MTNLQRKPKTPLKTYLTVTGGGVLFANILQIITNDFFLALLFAVVGCIVGYVVSK